MRSRLILAVLVLASLPACAQFTLDVTGGAIAFGAAPLNIALVPNGSGTKGNVNAAPGACSAVGQANFSGTAHFVFRGTTDVAGHQWEVVFVFNSGNEGNLTTSSLGWALTGKYEMSIEDTVTHAVCTDVVAASGEYQFEGPKLAGWPHKGASACNSPGQSPGLQGSLTLRGHANIFPKFVPAGKCSTALATEANARILNKGFDAIHLDYKLNY